MHLAAAAAGDDGEEQGRNGSLDLLAHADSSIQGAVASSVHLEAADHHDSSFRKAKASARAADTYELTMPCPHSTQAHPRSDTPVTLDIVHESDARHCQNGQHFRPAKLDRPMSVLQA